MTSSSTLDLSSARARVDAFAQREVLVLGDLVADHYVYGQTDRVSREAPVLIVRYEAAEVKLGGAANAAANVRSLGGQVRALGLLGEDEMGAALRKAFSESGIGVATVSDARVQTETKMRILAGGLNTTRQQMLRVDRGNLGSVPAELEERINARLREEAQWADAILVSDYGAGSVGASTRAVLRELGTAGKTICVDSRYALSEFRRAAVCKPNEPELEALTGMRITSEETLRAAGKKALALLECGALLVTRGHQGMALFEGKDRVELIPAHGAREAVDVTGAGDTVIAAFTLALAAGASLREAAQLANLSGARVVQKPGTATVSREELLAELAAA